MTSALLIAEKPDLMKQIKTVYTANKSKIPYEITFLSQRGHLIELKTPGELDEALKVWSWETLPIVPEDYGGWQYKIIQEKKLGTFLTSQERYNAIKKEIHSNKYDFVINAGDPDQEGELLIWETLKQVGNTLPVKRFWTNDLTEGAILNALQNLRDNKEPVLVNLLNAAYGRQHSDYRFGMNVSRAASLKMNTKVACGRVETPMLAIVTQRENEIKNFKPKTMYGVHANYVEGFEGVLFDKSKMSLDKEEIDEDKKNGTVWFDTKKEAEDFIDGLGNTGIVTTSIKKRTESYAPKLFKLATAQVAAGKLGYNDSQTLSILQDLYEKKLLSYPRTDCEYLSSKEDFNSILNAIHCISELAPYIDKITPTDIDRVRRTKKWINDKALEDSGHSALRPTVIPASLASLSKEETDIYTMICRQFVSIFLPPLIQDKAQIVVDIQGNTFRSSGSVLVSPGYTTLFGKTFTNNELPDLSKGDNVIVDAYKIYEKTTTCPKRFTSPDLIAVCENPSKYLDDASLKSLGKRLHIGTPATRSAIIRKLINSHKYLKEIKESKKVYLCPTELGMNIIGNLADCPICKVDMTGYWEEMLEDIRTGKMSLAEYETVMQKSVNDIINDIRTRDMKQLESSFIRKYKVVGKCPKCGNDIIESEKGFSCRGYKKDGSGCNIKMWKSKWHATFDYDDFTKLINGDTIDKEVSISGLKQKKELSYDWKNFDIMISGDAEHDIGTCPLCKKGNITANQVYFTCTNCDVKVYRIVCGAVLSDEEFLELLSGKDIIKTCSKDGSSWEQKLRFNKKEKKIEFAVDTSEYKCPACKKSKMVIKEKSYTCPKCKMTIWKTISGHTLTEEELQEICENGCTENPVEGMKKKDGTPFKKAPKLAVDKKSKSIVFEW